MTTTPQSPVAKRGDVLLVLFPNSDLRTAKTRPAVVLQADDLQTGLAQVIVAMITSKMFRARPELEKGISPILAAAVNGVVYSCRLTRISHHRAHRGHRESQKLR